MPSGKSSVVRYIFTYDVELKSAQPGQAITITLADEIDVSRGDMLVYKGAVPKLTNKLDAHIVWVGESPLRCQKEYTFKFATKSCVGRVSRLIHKIDINTLKEHDEKYSELSINEIGLTSIALIEQVAIDKYQELPKTGAFIVVDRNTYVTVGAGMIENISDEIESVKVYTSSGIALHKFIRTNFAEWECNEVC